MFIRIRARWTSLWGPLDAVHSLSACILASDRSQAQWTNKRTSNSITSFNFMEFQLSYFFSELKRSSLKEKVLKFSIQWGSWEDTVVSTALCESLLKVKTGQALLDRPWTLSIVVFACRMEILSNKQFSCLMRWSFTSKIYMNLSESISPNQVNNWLVFLRYNISRVTMHILQNCTWTSLRWPGFC